MGFVTDFLGITDSDAEKDARKAQQQANANATAMSKEQIALMKEQLEFQKEQYGDWKDIYGDLQENLGEYYKNIDANDIVAMGLTQQQRIYQEAVKEMERDYAQRGISGSGLEAATKAAATFQNAEARATIRAQAPSVVEAKQLGFLGLGLGQGTQMLANVNAAGSNVNTAYNTGVNSQTYMNANYLQQQTNLRNSNQSGILEFAGGVGSYGVNKGYF